MKFKVSNPFGKVKLTRDVNLRASLQAWIKQHYFTACLFVGAIAFLFVTSVVLATSPVKENWYSNFQNSVVVQWIPWNLSDDQTNRCEIRFGSPQYLALKYGIDEQNKIDVKMFKNSMPIQNGTVMFGHNKTPTPPLKNWTRDQLDDIKSYRVIHLRYDDKQASTNDEMTVSLANVSVALIQFQQCVESIQK